MLLLSRYIDADGNGRISACEVRDGVVKIYQASRVLPLLVCH